MKNNYYLKKENVLVNKLLLALIPIMIGLLTFFIIYGVKSLDVTNDKYILAGYDELDIIQHYSGWLAFRNSEWNFPLGLAKNMAVGDGTMISFTDSIPIVAIIFKCFDKFLPKTFQYFGIFTLLCYILQSIAAFKIIHLKTKNVLYSSLATILFVFAPIFLERSFRHTALGAQWIILFAIYFYLKHREDRKQTVYLKYLLLEILAIGIHPYFLPMVACFLLACCVYDKKEKYKSILYGLGIQILTYLFGVLIGVLNSGISLIRSGYGFFSMNINALINPTSVGGYTWSRFLKIRPQIFGNYDGFNYLGVGLLLFVIIIIILTIIEKKQLIMINILKKHLFLIIVSVLLTCFALSNVVTLDGHKLFQIPLPTFILELCGIFRASSRMFYPVYYNLIVFLLLSLWKLFREKRKYRIYVILIFVIVLQLIDISGCIFEKHSSMNANATYASFVYDTSFSKIAKGKKYVLLDDFNDNDIRRLSVLAFKNNLSTYFSIANSGNYTQSAKLSKKKLEEIKNNGNIGQNIIVTTNAEVVKLYTRFSNIIVYQMENYYFLFEKQK